MKNIKVPALIIAIVLLPILCGECGGRLKCSVDSKPTDIENRNAE